MTTGTAAIENKIALAATLTDTFGRVHDYLRISITDHCDLRCTYCMPADKTDFTPAAHLMTAKEIRSIAEAFVDMGVKKIRLTGGEPLVRTDARKIIQLLGELPVDLALTTNATRVDEFMDDFRNVGIRSVNVSLDTFDKEKFMRITRRDHFDRVISNIHLLIQNNFHVKVNAVVMNGVNDDELNRFVAFTKDYPVAIRFIEFMPFAGNGWSREKMVSQQQMLEVISKSYKVVKIEDEKNATSKKFKVPGHAGTFAFISTMTAPFCGDCNRLRLTADGKIKNCLFSRGEVDVLTSFRSGQDIIPLIVSSVRAKKKEFGGQQLFAKTENRSMVAIGG